MFEATQWLVTWPVLIPALAAATAVIAWGRPRAQSVIGLFGCSGQFIASLLLFLRVADAGSVSMAMGGWHAPFGVTFVADILGAGLALTTSGTASIIFLFGLSVRPENKRHSGFVPLLMVLLTGVAGVLLTKDIFNLYVWFEVTLITTLGLLVLEGNREQLDGALKYAIPNLLATTLLLISISMLYGMTGALNMEHLATKISELQDSATLQTIAMLLISSLAMKSALFPLSFWLPASYHTAGATIAAFFGALLTKVGVYALLRVIMTVFAGRALIATDILVWGASLTLIVSALGMLAETDLRRWVSFLVMSSAGFMTIGFALGGDHGTVGSILYVVHSIVVTAGFVMSAGLVVRFGGSTELSELSGLAVSKPALSALFLALGLSVSGIPPFTGFWPKFYLIQQGLLAENFVAVGAMVVSSLVTLIAVVRTFSLVFWRPYRGSEEEARPAGECRVATWAVAVLAIISLGLGALPETLLSFADRAANALVTDGGTSDNIKSIHSQDRAFSEWTRAEPMR